MSDQADIAADLRADGQEMTLTRTSGGVYDPVSGGISAPTVGNWKVYGITGNYNSITRANSFNGADSLIKSGDKKATIDATVEPQPGDTLTIMGVVWKVIMVDELSPQGEELLYVCQVRK